MAGSESLADRIDQERFDQTPKKDQSASVKSRLVERIRKEGPITFESFMQESLYGPQGFFASGRAEFGGRPFEGKVVTDPSKTPIYGQLIGTNLYDFWLMLGKPSTMDVVEMGAGTGEMARDILDFTRRKIPELHSAIRYRIIEVSPSLIAKQKESLADGTVEWIQASAVEALLPKATGVFLSNELVDNLPFHIVSKQGERLQELFIGEHDGVLTEVYKDPSAPELEAHLIDEGISLDEGERVWISLQARRLMHNLASALDRGFILTIDYGGTADTIYDPKKLWTPTTFEALDLKDANSDKAIYANPGNYDITAPVDFTALMREGEEQGFATMHYTGRDQYLLSLGLAEIIEALQQRARIDVLNTTHHREKLKEIKGLMNPFQKVLIQTNFEPQTTKA